MNLLPPPEQAPQAEAELSESEAAEVEDRLRTLGYIDWLRPPGPPPSPPRPGYLAPCGMTLGMAAAWLARSV